MDIPQLTPEEVTTYLLSAKTSPRRRTLKILHQPGAVFNQVINLVMADSYMQPHQHPDQEKVEEIWLLGEDSGAIFRRPGKDN